MRKILLASAALLGLAGTAGAQTATPAPAATPATPAETGAAKPAHPPRVVRHVRRAAPAAAAADADVRPGHVPGVGDSFPASGNASNIMAGDTRSVIAPRLPTPPGGPNGSAGSFLADAQRALNRGQTGLAQESLERAETAMLQRSVPVNQADSPDQMPDVMQVKAARDALANRDVAGAKRAVAAALSAGR